MKTNVFILLFCCFAGVQFVHAQNMNGSNAEVIYDPTFWRQDLKLSKEQYFAIAEINSEFYNNLIESAHQVIVSRENHISDDLLAERTKSIWKLLSQRQKTKWKKISRSFNDPTIQNN
jgi:hypothetical protein